MKEKPALYYLKNHKWKGVWLCHINKAMKNRKYNIVMDTPVGSRYGIIDLYGSDNQIRGTLDLLDHSEPFGGTIDSNGNCIICGHIITLMRTIDYTAIGRITEKSIELSLQSKQNHFKITGTVVLESEVDA